MSHPVQRLRQLFARQPWATGLPACLLLLAAILLLARCELGNQENPEQTSNQINGIAALSARDVWAVGSATGQGASPLIEHWDGRVWSLVPAPSKGERTILERIAAHSAQDIWAVGEFYQGIDEETLIEHWNGSSWSIVASPNGPGNNDLQGVAVISATDVWAVGTTIPCPLPTALVPREPGNALARARPAGRTDACMTSPYPQPSPLIEHWDGIVWSIVPSPSPDPEAGAYLSTVVAIGPEDVWASGSFNHLGVTPSDGAALMEQWDGTAWRIRTDFEAALGGRAWAAAFLSSSDIWVAEYTTSDSDKPAIKHWNGSDWSVVAGPPFGSGGYFVGAMAASAPDDLWAVGNHEPPQQDGHHDEVFTIHWNGSTWSLVPSPSPPGGYITLTASASLGRDDAWIIGQYEPSFGIGLTFIEHWDGRAWRMVPNPNPAQPAPVGQ